MHSQLGEEVSDAKHEQCSKAIIGALEESGAGLGISEADFGGKVKIEGKDPGAALQRRPERCVKAGLVSVHTGGAQKAREEMSVQARPFTNRL